MPLGRSTTFVPGVVICSTPLVYVYRQSASALATYNWSPTRAMPNGDLRSCRNTLRFSATPSPSASRNRTIRLGLGTRAPARAISLPCTQERTPLDGSVPGELVSATSTSPLGSTYNQRGCCRSVANAATASPGAAVGVSPAPHGLAGATLIVGTSECSGSGIAGFGPTPALVGSFAVPVQPSNATHPSKPRPS